MDYHGATMAARENHLMSARYLVAAATLVILSLTSFSPAAQASKEKFERDKPHLAAEPAGTEAGPEAETAAPVRAGATVQAGRATAPAATGTIQARPATTLSLCCGSVDTEASVGLNCAKLAAGKSCGGDILSCGPGCEEHVDSEGNGGCQCP